MVRAGWVKYGSLLAAFILFLGVAACAKSKSKALSPLALEPGAKSHALSLTEQGIQAYRGKQFEDAKTFFSQAVAEAPQSGPAHYNYALVLNVLGETAEARRHFIEAANLAPGDKVIWDSPPLSPYNNPEVEGKAKAAAPQNPNRRSGIGGR
jgi:Tfp pilus assembly protein PilF